MGGWAGKLNTRSKLGKLARERNKQTENTEYIAD